MRCRSRNFILDNRRKVVSPPPYIAGPPMRFLSRYFRFVNDKSRGHNCKALFISDDRANTVIRSLRRVPVYTGWASHFNTLLIRPFIILSGVISFTPLRFTCLYQSGLFHCLFKVCFRHLSRLESVNHRVNAWSLSEDFSVTL